MKRNILGPLIPDQIRVEQWDFIYRNLLEMQNTPPEGGHVFGQGDLVADETHLREHHVISMGGYRQTGKSTWALSQLVDDQSTIVIALTKPSRDDLIDRANKLFVGDGTEMSVEFGHRKIIVRVDPYDEDPVKTVNYIMGLYKQSPAARIFTWKDILSTDRDFSFVQRVIIDDCQFQQNSRFIMQWIAGLLSRHNRGRVIKPEDMVVVRLG